MCIFTQFAVLDLPEDLLAVIYHMYNVKIYNVSNKDLFSYFYLHGQHRILEFLNIKYTIDVESISSASWRGHDDTIIWLLQHGAQPDSISINTAIVSGYVSYSVIELLLKNKFTISGVTLYYLISNKNYDLIRLLCKYNCIVQDRDIELAIKSNLIEILHILLEFKTIKEIYLSYAIEARNKHIVYLLLKKYNVNINISHVMSASRSENSIYNLIYTNDPITVNNLLESFYNKYKYNTRTVLN